MPRLVTRRLARAFALVCLAIGWASPAWAQQEAADDSRVKVFLSCPACEKRPTVPFVLFVEDAASADIEAVVTIAGETRTIAFTGRGRFAGQNRSISVPAGADLERILKLGLAEYAAVTAQPGALDVTYKAPGAAAADAKKVQKDPWNFWVFRLSANAYGDGEQSASYGSYYLSTSANRTTEEWKVRLSGSRSVNRSAFDLGDGTEVKSRLTDWTVDSLIVKSLGPHWSLGMTSSVIGSTFSNAALVTRVAPGIEYDVFPYSESTKRSLTIQYTVGPAFYDYERETIFDKFKETIVQHTTTASLGLRQPWGQVGATCSFLQHLTALDRTRLTLNGSGNVRLFKSLTLNTSGSYSRIRDQFTLEKGDASDEEVLLRQRQLATGYRYSFSIGFGYSFGALSNATVNPRFGG